MTRLFQRAGVVIVNEIELTIDPEDPGGALDVAFDITRTIKPEPNTADIKIWNLSPDHRKSLEELDNVPVQVEAGYAGQTSLLFRGITRTVFTVREGPDLVTTLQTGDGEKEYKTARINIAVAGGPVTVAAGLSNIQAIRTVVRALGIGEGNLVSVQGQIAAAIPLFPNGTVLTGSASQILQRLLQSLGLEWSIQNGTLQILQAGQALIGTATVLTPETGLVGSPSVDNKGILSAQSLMIPDIFPGRLLLLSSEFLAGTFRIETCKYSGATAENDWYIDIEAKKL